MKFIVEINESTLQKIKEFQEQAQGLFPVSAEEIIRQLFMLADMDSGWLEDLTSYVTIREIKS